MVQIISVRIRICELLRYGFGLLTLSAKQNPFKDHNLKKKEIYLEFFLKRLVNVIMFILF